MIILVVLEPGTPGQAGLTALAKALRWREEAQILVATATAGNEAPGLNLALSLGAHQGFMVRDSLLGGADYRARGTALAALATFVQADLVLLGDRSGREGRGVTAAALAHPLGQPLVASACDVVRGPPGFVCADLQREGRICRLRIPLPAVISLTVPAADAALADPLQPFLPVASPKAIGIIELQALGLERQLLGNGEDGLGEILAGPLPG